MLNMPQQAQGPIQTESGHGPILLLGEVVLRDFINRIEQCLVPLFLRSLLGMLLSAPRCRVRPPGVAPVHGGRTSGTGPCA